MTAKQMTADRPRTRPAADGTGNRSGEITMPVTQIVCDACGKTTSDFAQDYDGYYCTACKAKKDIEEARADYESKKRWLVETHLNELARLKQKLDELESKQ